MHGGGGGKEEGDRGRGDYAQTTRETTMWDDGYSMWRPRGNCRASKILSQCGTVAFLFSSYWHGTMNTNYSRGAQNVELAVVSAQQKNAHGNRFWLVRSAFATAVRARSLFGDLSGPTVPYGSTRTLIGL